MLVPVTLKVMGVQSATLLLHPLLLHKLCLSGGEVYLGCGKARHGVTLEPCETGGEHLVAAGAQLLAGLGLAAGTQLQLQVTDNFLRLGPLLGILYNQGCEGCFGEQGLFFEELSAWGERSYVQVYLFTPEGINWEQGTISGLTYQRGWQRRSFPFPDVCYNRFFRTHGGGGLTPGLLDRFNQRGVRMINRLLPHKLEVYSTLWQREELRPYLPITTRYKHPEQIRELLALYPTVYLKPISGCKGRGIVRISYGRKRLYHCRFTEEVDRCVPFGTLASFGWQKENYLIQQGISLIAHPGPADIRVLVQKDGCNHWMLVGCAVRIGRSGSITTNLHTGATARRLPEVLRELWPSERDRQNMISDELRWLALAVAGALDERMRGALGELGIDLALDVAGRLWFLDANPKPGRRSFLLTGERSVRERSASMLIDYAQHLSNFR